MNRRHCPFYVTDNNERQNMPPPTTFFLVTDCYTEPQYYLFQLSDSYVTVKALPQNVSFHGDRLEITCYDLILFV
jgi:hypothetical protein